MQGIGGADPVTLAYGGGESCVKIVDVLTSLAGASVHALLVSLTFASVLLHKF